MSEELSINVHDVVNISEVVQMETELEVGYRDEFLRHEKEYLLTKKDEELIFSLIFLQIWVECFLHQNMRRIVTLEFNHSNKPVVDEWLREDEKNKGERRYIQQKLEELIKLFYPKIPSEVQTFINDSKDCFNKISDVRNHFVHGRKISAWSDSEGGSGTSNAKLLLSPEQLIITKKNVNNLGLSWNKLLDKILEQCKSLKNIEDFKFKEFF